MSEPNTTEATFRDRILALQNEPCGCHEHAIYYDCGKARKWIDLCREAVDALDAKDREIYRLRERLDYFEQLARATP
jgi:hypothetical protein